MKIKALFLATLCLSASVVLFTGCQSDTHNIVQNASGDGIYGKAAVPVGSWGSVGLSAFIGRFSETVAVQPTSTNKVYAPNVAVVTAGHGKETVTGSSGTSTNGAAGIAGGSWDAQSILTGGYTVDDSSRTNGAITIDQK
jgi:hypothetical protein